MDQKFLELHDVYAKGSLDRREFFKKAARLAGGTAAVSALLPFLESGTALAQVVPQDDPRLRVENIRYPGATGEMKAYFARPKGEAKLPGVIVIHENRGLNPHTEDVARRVALGGYLAIAPDALSPFGGTPANPSEAQPLFQKLDAPSNIKNFVAAVQYLKTHPQATGKVGCMGFCWGGGITNQVAVNSPDLAAAVPFYGMQPSLEDVPKIKASMLIHYAGNDERINAGIAAFEEALKTAGVKYRIFMYEGAGHAFFNDTNPGRYNKEAAELAWRRTIDFFGLLLKS
jgi:carboxymethylenebutenolidase